MDSFMSMILLICLLFKYFHSLEWFQTLFAAEKANLNEEKFPAKFDPFMKKRD